MLELTAIDEWNFLFWYVAEMSKRSLFHCLTTLVSLSEGALPRVAVPLS